MESGKHIHLLKSFFDRLELAGIAVSPADYVRIATILDSKLKVLSSDNEKLSELNTIKFLIAPIIARSATDQQLVYQVFDDYLSDIALYTAKYAQSESSVINDLLDSGTDFSKPISMPKYLLALLLLFLAIAGFLFVESIDKEVYAWKVEDYSKDWMIGDSIDLSYKEIGKDDGDEHRFYWQLFDRSNNELYKDSTTVSKWEYVVDSELETDYLYVVFSVVDEFQNPIFSDTTVKASVYCSDIPVLRGIEVKGTLGRNKEIELSPVLESESSDVNYQWIISNGKESITFLGKTCSYKTGNAGVANIELKAFRPNMGVNCESTFFKALELEQRTDPPFAEIDIRPLQFFKGNEIASFKSFVWIAWLILALITFYFIRIFRNRLKYRQSKQAANQLEKSQNEKCDKPPYAIEFKDENKSIHSFEERSVLSKAMHERRYKDGYIIDVNGTINATISNRGFPDVVYRKDSEPTQYLFLIHQTHRHSHDARLFEHLADLMKEDDVLMLKLFYKDNPALPYSDDYPDGVSLHQLKSRNGAFRVILFTEGSELVNTHAGNRFGLDAELLELKSVFEDLFFVSPKSVSNWSVNEASLYRIGLLFPANLNGLLELSKCLEFYDPEDDRKSFKDWRGFLLSSSDGDNEIFDEYKSPEPYRDLLDSKLLYEWFLALSVFPTPNWDFTISVGKALEKRGLYLSFENLLKLSRIPALHKASFHPALLDKMHKSLQEIPEVEIIARRVLQEKLKEVDYQNLECFVSGTHEVLTVKNDFLIDPEDESNINNVLRLIRQKRLSKIDMGDLVRHTVDPNLKKSVGKSFNSGLDQLNNKLNTTVNQLESKRSKRRMIIGFSLNIWALFLIYSMYILLSFDNTPILANASKENNLMSFLNFSETMPTGMQLNNAAVQLYEDNEEQLLIMHSDSNQIIITEIEELLDSAIVLMPESQFIKDNQLNIQLNIILTNLKYIEDNNLWTTNMAEDQIEVITNLIDPTVDEYLGSDSLYTSFEIELKHLRGLAYFYNGQLIDAIQQRDSILDGTPEYFSSVAYSPTLIELLPIGGIAKQFKMEGHVYDAKNSPYEEVKIVVGNNTTFADNSGFYTLIVDNPSGQQRMEVILEVGGIFDKVTSSESIKIDNRLSYEQDFIVSSVNEINQEEELDKPKSITINTFDDRGRSLNGVELYFGEQRFLIDGVKTIDVPQTKGYTIQVSANKKGYKRYVRTINTKRIVDAGSHRIVMEKEATTISVHGNVHDGFGQGLKGYTIQLGDDCQSKSSGRDGRFLLSCEIPAYAVTPKFLILKDEDGNVIDRKPLGRKRKVLFIVDQIKK